VGFIADQTQCDVYFVEYLFRYLRSRIQFEATGSVQDNINLGTFSRLKLPLPPLPEQRRIAAILSGFDDKIELNRRMNATLEATARALFKSWFVDFDPVRAKMEGRQPEGMDAETAALFPDRLVESALGQIPEGWEYSSLGDLFSTSKDCVLTGPFGSNLHSSDYRDEGTPLILVRNVNNGQIVEDDIPLVGSHKLPDLERYILQEGDIVFTRVGAVGRSAYIHMHNVGWLISGQTLRVRVPSENKLIARYLAQVYLEPEFIRMVDSFALGTTRPSLNTTLLLEFKFLFPPWSIQKAFKDFVIASDAQIQQNNSQNKVLVAARDALLPKLVSGQVRVGDEA